MPQSHLRAAEPVGAAIGGACELKEKPAMPSVYGALRNHPKRDTPMACGLLQDRNRQGNAVFFRKALSSPALERTEESQLFGRADKMPTVCLSIRARRVIIPSAREPPVCCN